MTGGRAPAPGTAWLVARRSLRRRRAGALGLVLMVAATSGSVAGLVAGARRTAEAFPEFVASARETGDVAVFAQLDPDVPFEAADQAALKDLLDELPEVDRSTRATLVILEGVDRTGHRRRLLGNLELDPGRALVFGRPRVVAGTWPDPSDPGAVAIDEELAARAGLGVGDTYRVAPFTIAQFGPAGEGADVRPAGPASDLRVEAIYRHPVDLQPVELDHDDVYVDHSGLHLTPAYWTAHGPDLARYGVAVVVDLAPGASRRDLAEALRPLLPGGFTLERASVNGSSDALAGIDDAIELQARGMLGVALGTGITGSALLLLLLGRKAAADEAQDRTLGDLGLGPRGRRGVAALEATLIGLAGAVLGAAVAVASSAWMPFGLAALAESDPGVQVDVPVIAAAVVATTAATGAAAWIRRPASRLRTSSASKVADGLARRGLPPVPTTGVRFALEAGGTAGTVPVRVAFAGVALSAVIAVAAATVGASLDEVDREPARRGAYGDLVLGNAASPAAADAIADRLARHPDVAGFAGEAPNEVDIDGRTTWVVALFGGPGELTPRVVAGRPPREADEIALGGPVLRDLGVGVGDTVEVTFTAEPVEMRVVGQSLVDDVDGSNGGPGKSGLVDASALPVLDPDGVDSTAPVWFVVDLRPDVDRGAALARLRQDFPNVVTTSRMPTDLRNLERLQGLVALLAVLVGLLGSGASLLALIGAVTRRRRELAVLRTLGFARRQAAAVVAWQATTFAVVGLVVGLPLGLALGRQGWIAVAEVLGIRPSPIVPVGVVLAVATATVVALNLVATLPAWVAGRVRPAEELRSE